MGAKHKNDSKLPNEETVSSMQSKSSALVEVLTLTHRVRGEEKGRMECA